MPYNLILFFPVATIVAASRCFLQFARLRFIEPIIVYLRATAASEVGKMTEDQLMSLKMKKIY